MGLIALDRDEDDGRDDAINMDVDWSLEPPLPLNAWIDVFYEREQIWLEAQIIAREARLYLVHYKGIKSLCDEWISHGSSRIGRLHSHTPARASPGPPLELGMGTMLSVLDTREIWMPGEVTDLSEDQVRVHYINMHTRYDEWINRDSYRLAEQHANASVLPEPRSAIGELAALCLSESKAIYRATIQNEDNFRSVLRARMNASIIEMDFDGNCLFRAVSHQVYGDARYHADVRRFCCDYMERERDFFASYTTDDQFGDYLTRMRRAGEWGDHLEIQAMSEIYRRPVLVYAYSPEPMRTYSETKSRTTPMRLSYHFESHYNSIVLGDPSRHPHDRPPPPGELERAALSRPSARSEDQIAVLADRIDSLEFESAVNDSLTLLLEAECKSQSLLEMDASDDLQKALDESRQLSEATTTDDMTNAVAESLQDMPVPIQRCHLDLQFPLDMCISAYTAFERVPDDDAIAIEQMAEWIISNSFID